MRNLFTSQSSASLIVSKLHDQDSFYTAFEHDLGRARKRIVIEEPIFDNAPREHSVASVR